jgi:hypothetical protein
MPNDNAPIPNAEEFTQEQIDNFDVDHYLQQKQYGSTGQAAIAGLEGAGRGVVGPLAPMAEKALGVSEEGIRGRKSANPLAAGAGETAGLIGGALTGVGEGALLEGAGKAVGSLVEHKIGSAAIKAAAEGALYQSGDEMSKAVLQDPNQSVGSAVASIGLSGLLGGTLGAISGSVSPLWQATVGKKLGAALGDVAEKSGGIEGQEAAQSVGIDPFTQKPFEGSAPSAPKSRSNIDPFTKEPTKTPPIKKELEGNPLIQKEAAQYQESIGLPKESLPKIKVSPATGKQIAAAYEAMKHDPNNPAVKSAYDALIKETLDQYQLVKKMGIIPEFIPHGAPNPYPGGSKDVLSDIKKGHLWVFPTESPEGANFGSGEDKFAGNPLLQKTNEYVGDKQLVANDVFRIVHDIFGHAKEGNSFGPTGEENAWRAHVKMYSPQAARAMTTETRGQNSWVNFGPKGEANRANPANTHYADQKTGLLPEWISKVPDREQSVISSSAPYKSTSQVAPGLQSTLKTSISDNALGLLLAATGHGNAAVLTTLANMLRKPGMEAIKRASLKFLGTAKPISAEGFSAMADMLGAAGRGTELADKATKAVFSGSRVLESSEMPSKDDVKHLDETLKHLEENPGALLGKPDHLGHYLPDHSTAVAALATNAQTYLNSLRPRADKQAPLDSDPEISKAQSQPFQRALMIAQQPLLVLQHLKNGTLVPQDVQTIERLYPALYKSLAGKLTDAMIEHTAQGKAVNYHTRQALSLFAGHALDSTLTPQAIQASQATHQPKQAPQPPLGQTKRTTAKLGAIAQETATPDQQRQMHRASKG